MRLGRNKELTGNITAKVLGVVSKKEDGYAVYKCISTNSKIRFEAKGGQGFKDIEIGRVIKVQYKIGSGYRVIDDLTQTITGTVMKCDCIIQPNNLYYHIIIDKDGCEYKGNSKRMSILTSRLGVNRIFNDASIMVKGDRVRVLCNYGRIVRIILMNDEDEED